MTARAEILAAFARLEGKDGRATFSLSEVVREVQVVGTEYEESTIRTHIVSNMCIDAPPNRAISYADLERVGRGQYRRRQGTTAGSATRKSEPRTSGNITARASGTPGSPPAPKRARRARVDIAARATDLATYFDTYVEWYDKAAPFRRAGQYSNHRATIDRRRQLGSVGAALDDDEFLQLLHSTLKTWGIGKRGSVLIPLPEFRMALASHREELMDLQTLSIEDPALPVPIVADRLATLIDHLGVTPNKARVVAGTKTLHHLLPDLVVPMDREWTGRFFGWSTLAPQQSQRRIATEAYITFAEVARATTPSRLVGMGWHTSATKILDNAVIGYCMAREVS